MFHRCPHEPPLGFFLLFTAWGGDIAPLPHRLVDDLSDRLSASEAENAHLSFRIQVLQDSNASLMSERMELQKVGESHTKSHT